MMTRLAPVLGLVTLLATPIAAADLPVPPPPADFELVRWGTVADYFREVDRLSDRVVVRELGETTEGRPYLAAIVSSEGTIAELGRFRELQASLVDPEVLADPARIEAVAAASKPVVLITCSIHSSETASTFMAMRLLRDLAGGDDEATREILDNVILVLVPSANPDGVDIVADWYPRTKGTPWEGSGLPRLYHKYAGHDTNRDWFMLNLAETRHLSRLLYREWFPTITYDVHQMGSKGPRLFVPPFHDPINPNLDPRLHQAIAMIGSHMAFDLAAAGKRGVGTRMMYDNWWNGGNRTVPQRHNMVGLLTEAASVKLASPIFLEKSELRGGGRGFPDHKPSVDFIDPWPGGWWRLADIAEYERICARSVLTLAARYRQTFQRNFAAMNRDAIAKGRTEPPFAWIVPADQRDTGTAAEMVRILHDTGIRVEQTIRPAKVGGREIPLGSWVLPADQPFRPHLKDMMERQRYPDRVDAAGNPEPPYDVAGWTLPLQMGVEVVEAIERAALETEPVAEVKTHGLELFRNDPAGGPTLSISNGGNDVFRLLNLLLDAGQPVELVAEAEGNASMILTPMSDHVREILAGPAAGLAVSAVEGEPVEPEGMPYRRDLKPRRIGVYQPWQPSMDEGWTRLVLERFGFPYETLHNADIRAGELSERLDVLVIPSIGTRTLREGYGADETEPEYVGGLGQEGAEAIRAFVEAGGVLVCLEDSCLYAIEELSLPVKEVTRGLRSSEFYGPGSIVAIRYNADSRQTVGMPEEGSAYFDRSLAFEVEDPEQVGLVATYAPTDVLQSGWLLGADKIAGKAAELAVRKGKGVVILFGFPPQHRGQPHGTFRLLFNALLLSGPE